MLCFYPYMNVAIHIYHEVWITLPSEITLK